MKSNKIILKAMLVVFITFILSFEGVAKHDQKVFFEDKVPNRPVLLEDMIGWLNNQNDRFFISGCRVENKGALSVGFVPLLISIKNAEYLFIYDPSQKETKTFGVAVWEKGIVPGYFETNGGLWSHAFATKIYDNLKNKTFRRLSSESLESLIMILSEDKCDF
jgi:hypothetical protein